MKKDISFLVRRWQLPLLLLLSVMPLMLMQLCLDAPDALPASGALFAAFAAVSGVCLFVPGSRRIPAAVLGSVFLLAISLLVLPIGTHPSLLFLPAALIVLLFFSLPLALRQYESEIPPFVYVAGVLIHAVTQFLHHHFALTGGVSPYEPIDGALTATLIGYILLFLLSMNRISLDNASLARHRLPASMRRFNTALTLAFMALALAIAALPAVAHAIRVFAGTLAEVLARLSAWLLSLLPSAGEIGDSSAPAAQALPELASQTEPSALAQLLEKIAYILSMVILVGGGLFLLFLLYGQLRRLVRWLLARFKRYVVSASSDYDDEITDTRGDGAQRENHFTRRAFRRAAAYDGTPSGRIRQTYARLLRRNPKWAASSTARENLPEQAAVLYERTRYSDHPVTGEDAERFAAETKKA